MRWGLLALGVGAGLGVLLFREGFALAKRGHSQYTNAEWLARVVIMEAGDIGPGPEWAGIMHVALNRARIRKWSLERVVSTTSWPGGGSAGRMFCETIKAPGGEGYEDSKGRPSPADRPRYVQALAFAEQVLLGRVANPIGNLRQNFVHPGGMPRCSPEGVWREDGERKCVDGRWLPRWMTPEGAANPIIRVGRALFS